MTAASTSRPHRERVSGRTAARLRPVLRRFAGAVVVALVASGSFAAPVAAAAPVANDVDLNDLPANTVLVSTAVDIVAPFATDPDGGLAASSLSFDSATIDGAPAGSPAVVGLSYLPGAGTAGTFTVDPTVAAFDGLGPGASADVEVSFTVTDPGSATDTGLLRYTVAGDPGPYDELSFAHEGPDTPGVGIDTDHATGPGRTEASVVMTGPATLTAAMVGYDFAALSAPVQAAGSETAIAVAGDGSTASAAAEDGSVASADATDGSSASATSAGGSAATATSASSATANAVARTNSKAVADASDQSDATAVAQQSSVGSAEASGSSSSSAVAEGSSAASASASFDSVSTVSASAGSASEAAATEASVADAAATDSSVSTATAFERSAASATAEGTSSATSFAHTDSAATATATNSSITNAVAIDGSAADATANDSSDALAFAEDAGDSVAESNDSSSASAAAEEDAVARSGAQNRSTSVADAAALGNAISDAVLDSVSLAEAHTGASARAGACRSNAAWGDGVDGSTAWALVPVDLPQPEITDDAPATAGIRLPEVLAAPAATDVPLPFDVVGAGGAVEAVLLSGFPDGTVLSAGTGGPGGRWAFAGVPPTDLTFRAPAGYVGTFTLGVHVDPGGERRFAAASMSVVVDGDDTPTGESVLIHEVTAAVTVEKARLADRAMNAITQVIASARLGGPPAAGTATPERVRAAARAAAVVPESFDCPSLPGDPTDPPDPTDPGPTDPGPTDPGPTDPGPDPAPPVPRDIEDACPATRVPDDGFVDTAGNVHDASIACIRAYLITEGVTPTAYDPSSPVRREQMASFLARLLGAVGYPLPVDPPDAFPDDDGSVHELAINQLAALGVVEGRPDGSFGFGDHVTRGQLASFVIRAIELFTGTPVGAGDDHFGDDDGSTHESNIGKIAGLGIAVGDGAGNFNPGDPVRRDQMASFLARTLDHLVEDAGAPSAFT